MTGDQADIATRLRALLPAGWFPDTAPNLSAVLAGASDGLAAAYALIAYAKAQARIKTASGFWLDLVSRDFFGTALPRRAGESDDGFRARILARMFRLTTTRAAIAQGLTALTGRAPTIIEPWNTGDCGAWDGVGGIMAWDTAGAWGELDLPNQLFIRALRPASGGVANVMGWAAVEPPANNPGTGQFTTADATANITLSADGLTASCATNATYGEAVRSNSFRSSGKWYFEVTLGSAVGSGGTALIGLASQSATLAANSSITGMIGRASSINYQQAYGGIGIRNNGAIMDVIASNTAYGFTGLANMAAGDVLAFAVDFDGGKFWARDLSKGGTPGQWNLALNGDPVAGTGSIALPAGALSPYIGVLYGRTGTLGTLNNGTSAFTGTVPTGFTSGWGLPLTGIGWAGGGWDQGGIEWVDQSMFTGPATDADIYQAIEELRPAGVTAWVNLAN